MSKIEELITIINPRKGTWYQDLINESFNVVDNGGDYVLSEDYNYPKAKIWRHIMKEDCLITKDHIQSQSEKIKELEELIEYQSKYIKELVKKVNETSY